MIERETYFDGISYIALSSKSECAQKLGELEDKIERGELVEVVTCEHCINHVDTNYHFCRKLRIECPNDSDFYCKYGERSGENAT